MYRQHPQIQAGPIMTGRPSPSLPRGRKCRIVWPSAHTVSIQMDSVPFGLLECACSDNDSTSGKRVKSHIESLERIALGKSQIEVDLPAATDIEASHPANDPMGRRHEVSPWPPEIALSSSSMHQIPNHGTPCQSGKHHHLSPAQPTCSQPEPATTSQFGSIERVQSQPSLSHPLQLSASLPQTNPVGYDGQFSSPQHNPPNLSATNVRLRGNSFPDPRDNPNIPNRLLLQQTLFSTPFGQGFLTLQWRPGSISDAGKSLENPSFRRPTDSASPALLPHHALVSNAHATFCKDTEDPESLASPGISPSSTGQQPSSPHLWQPDGNWDSLTGSSSCKSCECRMMNGGNNQLR